MQVLFMDAHMLETRCCSYLCIPECFHLHLLHYIHCIASVQGGVSASGGALGLFSLDVCMCQQGGEFWVKWSNKGETCLIFEKSVVHRALRVHHFGRVALVRGKSITWGVSALVLAPGFLIFPLLPAWLRRALPLSLRSYVLAFDRLRRAVALVLGNRSVLE